MIIKSFFEIGIDAFTQSLSESIKNEIKEKGKEYILRVDEGEFKNYLFSKYLLEPLIINLESENIPEPYITKEWRSDKSHDGKYQVEKYIFTAKYHFAGSAVLFRIKPNSFIYTNYEIQMDDQTKTVSFNFELINKNPEEFKKIKNETYRSAFSNIENVNKEAENWNNRLLNLINTCFQRQKTKYKEENDFFEAINVKVNKDTTSIFTAPTIKKKIIPQPIVDKNKRFSSVPEMSQEMYDDILKVIYDSGKSMERKPALYKDKDEEGLRDQFLFVLETRYEGTTATGETFNRIGDSDIILKYAEDGSNLFVAECKFWNGISEFQNAISQLFDRYLTWHDSKTALLIFVKNKDFSNVLQAIKNDIKSHPYFIREVGNRREASFSYIFRLPQDKDKQVYFEVLVFHYDK